MLTTSARVLMLNTPTTATLSAGAGQSVVAQTTTNIQYKLMQGEVMQLVH